MKRVLIALAWVAGAWILIGGMVAGLLASPPIAFGAIVSVMLFFFVLLQQDDPPPSPDTHSPTEKKSGADTRT